ncbi:hypothetical protein GCM10022414_29990 [Zhongshania borealis]|uniref:Uncharacterized protein n=1 Tax=Zhongshania borealis TaxID=889488 RepID=A0ABP7X1B0_9GAMM
MTVGGDNNAFSCFAIDSSGLTPVVSTPAFPSGSLIYNCHTFADAHAQYLESLIALLIVSIT